MAIKKIFCSFFVCLLFAILFCSIFSLDAMSIGMGEDLIAREAWKRISLDFEGAPLLQVLKIFSQQSGLNFIASSEIESKAITLYLDKVPLREALERILNYYNLTYELDESSNIFVIKQLMRPEVETITRVYPLQYARIDASPLNKASATSTSGSSLKGVLNNLISSHGKISEDIRTNSLIVTDVPIQFEVIEEAIRKLDIPIPQVVIEVEIIDVKKSLVDKLGMVWGSADEPGFYSLKLAGVDNMPFPFRSHNRDSTTGTQLTTGSVTSGVGATLQLYKADTDTKILARPRILTLSNETAEIKIAGNNKIGTIVTYDDSGQQSGESAERTDIGVTLKVTPAVNSNTGQVTMVLEPKVTSGETSSLGGIDPQERSAKVTVIVKDNDTMVIGGLLRRDTSDGRTKLPVFGDIPFFGALFRSKNSQDDERELLVFITPRIVKSEGGPLVKSAQNYDKGVLNQREQAGYQYRNEEIDKSLDVWDNK